VIVADNLLYQIKEEEGRKANKKGEKEMGRIFFFGKR
jgi:hypothetical protein